jgi:3-deoxy-manno-octulosonate cytidylyltransferase (CMP-KDO synthetase)
MSAQAEIPSSQQRPKALAVIPARLASTRLPRKMLLSETGSCLFVHTARNAERSGAFERVIVATDCDEVQAAAEEAGLAAIPTNPACPSGTDRVHEALTAAGGDYEVVVGVQGDEPELTPGDLERLVDSFNDETVSVATLAAPIEDERALNASSVVKVVLNSSSDALYFSRAAIPDRSHARADATPNLGLRHVGVYAWRPAALARFRGLKATEAEQTENLEQLRWLENGGRMRVLVIDRAPHGVDTHEDYEAFVERWQSANKDVTTHTTQSQRAST